MKARGSKEYPSPAQAVCRPPGSRSINSQPNFACAEQATVYAGGSPWRPKLGIIHVGNGVVISS